MKPTAIAVHAAAAATLVIMAVPARAADAVALKEPGYLWEVTSKMSMEGMPMEMPARTTKVCTPKSSDETPIPPDDRCQMSDVRRSGATVTWTVRCSGSPAMNGTGEMTRTSPEAYKGWMKMSSDEGTMNMTISGRRVGDCDATAAKKDFAKQTAAMEAQAAAAQKQSADAQAQACRGYVEGLDLRTLDMMTQATACTGADYRADLCKRFGTDEGYAVVCQRKDNAPGNGLSDLAKACGTDVAPIKQRVCDAALAKESLDVLGKCCEEQAAVLAEKVCGGLDTSAKQGQYGGFCATYGQEAMAGAKKDQPKPETKKDKTKKGLKGIWP